MKQPKSLNERVLINLLTMREMARASKNTEKEAELNAAIEEHQRAIVEDYREEHRL